MKRLLLFILGFALLLSPSISYASGWTSSHLSSEHATMFGGLAYARHSSNTVQTLINANNEVGLSYNYYTQYYTERIGDNENGGISGLGLSVTALSNVLSVPMVYEHLAYTNDSGNFNYTDGADGENSTDNANILGVSARIGKALFLNSRTMLIPYVAYNYRKWDRNLSNGYAGGIEYLGYQEIYSYDALGLGLLGEYAINDALVLKGRLQYSQMLGNTLNTYDMTGYPNMTFNLKNEPVYTVGVGLDYDISGTPLHVTAGIKYVKTYFGKSNANVLGFYEPNSMTTGLNYNLGLAYSF
jgi:hypothetical protein